MIDGFEMRCLNGCSLFVYSFFLSISLWSHGVLMYSQQFRPPLRSTCYCLFRASFGDTRIQYVQDNPSICPSH